MKAEYRAKGAAKTQMEVRNAGCSGTVIMEEDRIGD